eukprot:5010968-Prorocentrum_lima.AAC.1
MGGASFRSSAMRAAGKNYGQHKGEMGGGTVSSGASVVAACHSRFWQCQCQRQRRDAVRE